VSDLVSRLTEALAGRYAIEREIGRGGMATVYLATDLKHNRKVALKVLHPELAASVGHERFLREIEIVAGLTHPRILTLIDSGEADGLLFFVMPYVEGDTLKERLEREGALPVEDSLKIAREVADALAYAHDKGVIHRDIKPSNILFEAGHAVISDFGVARAVGVAGEKDATATGMTVGTRRRSLRRADTARDSCAQVVGLDPEPSGTAAKRACGSRRSGRESDGAAGG
jgi:serine/threonine-protein kinase